MSRALNLVPLLIGICAGILPVGSRGEEGPVVQVFTRDTADGSQAVVPLWKVPVHVAISVNGGYNENVNTLPSDPQGSAFTNASIVVDYMFGTSRTRANLRTGTGVTYYLDLPDNRYDPNLYLDLSVTHQVNLRLSLVGSVHASYQAEPDFATDLGVNRRAGNYFSSQDNIAASYQWLPRFSTVTSYSLGAVHYDGEAIGASQDRVDHQFAQSWRFLFLPVTTLVADYQVALADYADADRGSTSHSILAGIDHTFLPGLNASVRAGTEFRSSDQIGGSSDSSVGPHIQGNLTYAVGGKTSLNWTASYSTEESNVATSPGSLTFRTGLQVNYALTGRVSCNLSGYYVHGENEASAFLVGGNPSFTEDSLDLSLALTYAINRYFSANVGYNRTEVDSDVGLRSYSQNRYFSGLTFSF